MANFLIKHAQLVNEGRIFERDLLIRNQRIERIDSSIDVAYRVTEIQAEKLHLLPGVIDDQVHFREPGLTHKATIHSEAKAALAGGVTSFMEMPNTKPAALTQQLLEDKYQLASRSSLANYSFFMGVSNENYEEVMKTNKERVCGIKIFMGSSTGNMLVDNEEVLNKIFRDSPMLIATHCEDERTIKENLEHYKQQYGDKLTAAHHPMIRDEEACYLCSSLAVALAKKHNTRLHVLHISTAEELNLFDNKLPLEKKRITAEVCVHHLWFDADDYNRLGNLIKCNPAIKDKRHKHELFKGLLDNRLDVIATDHAPHTWEEKQQPYLSAPAGLPLVQHPLNVMLQFFHHGKISLEQVVEKMSHAPAVCFQVKERGFIREGYYADLVLLDLAKDWTVGNGQYQQSIAPSKESKKYEAKFAAHEAFPVQEVNYQCGWSPFAGYTFGGQVLKTFVNGHLAYNQGEFDESIKGERLLFSGS